MPTRERPLIPDAAPAIEIRDLQFAWGRNCPATIAIEHLRVARGERIFLMGPSGSGKSTLLGLIGGVLQPQHGTLRILGTSIESLRASERDRFRGAHVGFIFQMFNLIPYLSVRDNVLLPLRFSQTRRARLAGIGYDTEAERILAALGLTTGLLDRSVTHLSIGQQQRVAAARALIGKPDIVIADEPTSSLDSDARSGFLRLLLDECRSIGTTLVFVSHDTQIGIGFERTLRMEDFNSAGGSAL